MFILDDIKRAIGVNLHFIMWKKDGRVRSALSYKDFSRVNDISKSGIPFDNTFVEVKNFVLENKDIDGIEVVPGKLSSIYAVVPDKQVEIQKIKNVEPRVRVNRDLIDGSYKQDTYDSLDFNVS